MKSTRTHRAFLTGVMILGSATLSQAALTIGDLISVNLTANDVSYVTPSGAAVIGASGDSWNDLSAGAGSNVSSLGTVGLNKVDGTSSGASLAISTGFFNGSSTPGTNLDLYRGNIYLDGDGEFGPSGPATITLTGLGAGTVINLYLYGGAGHTSGEGASFTFGSTTNSLNDPNGDETGYTLNSNYVFFNNLVADGSGTITGTWQQASGQRFSSFSGLQIAAVPEPSAALLGGLGMLCLLRRRR
jgi:PEP-CTERM motif